jgi:hypothetical protein
MTDAQLAELISNLKNARQKLLETKAAMWLSKIRRVNQHPNIMQLKIKGKISKKIKDRKNKKEHIMEIMGVKEKPDVIDIIERKRLQWYGHVKRMQEERLLKLIMELIPGARRKRGRPRKTWMEVVRAAMKTRHLEADQWLN